MSCSEEETNVASVLSQMSQMQQTSPDTSVEAQGMNVAHQCDVETTSAKCTQVSVDGGESAVQESLATSSELYPESDKTSAATSFELCSDDQDARLQTTLEVSLVKVFPCEFCGKAFNKSYNLKTHLRVHTRERPYPCLICAHGFANLGDLKRHARTHTGEKPFTCEFCDKSFSDFGSHKRHLRLHTGVKPFKCDQCERQFTRLDSYKNHTRLHTGERPYKCDECQKEFNYLTTYKRHLNVHSGERPFSCELCGKKFTRMNYLRSHKINHKNVSSTSDDNLPENVELPAGTVELQQSEEIPMRDLTEEHGRENGNENADDVIQQVAQALFQGGVEVSVTTIGDNNDQAIVIPTSDSGETTSHTLIFAQNMLDSSSSPADRTQQMIHLTEASSDKHVETRQLFLSQPLFKITQDTGTHEVGIESNFIEQTFEGIVSVTQEEGSNVVVGELQEKDTEKQPQDILNDGSCDPSITVATNGVYIAVDPVQPSVQQIMGELHVAVNPE